MIMYAMLGFDHDPDEFKRLELHLGRLSCQQLAHPALSMLANAITLVIAELVQKLIELVTTAMEAIGCRLRP